MIPLGILGNRRGGAAAGAYELIETNILGSNASSITFSSIPGTYKHLEIRVVARASTSSYNSTTTRVTLNGDTGANYSSHDVGGSGTSVSSNASTGLAFMRNLLIIPSSASTASAFGSGVISILDYASTTKFKTLRSLAGWTSNLDQGIQLGSGSWRNTAAVTSITLTDDRNSYVTGSRFSLYGIKG